MKDKIRKLENALDFPEGIIDDVPKIICYGKDRIVIENFIGISEYDENIISLNTGIGEIHIYGNKITLPTVIKNELVISGDISSIEFER